MSQRTKKPFTLAASVIFAVVAVGHLLRIVYGSDVILGGWAAPMWVSYFGCVVPAGLAVMLWREARR